MLTSPPSEKLLAVASSRRGVEETQNTLVHAEHDGRAGYRPHQMWRQPAVQTHEALLDPHDLEALE